MPQTIGEKHREMHDLLERALGRIEGGEESVDAMKAALAWYDRMILTFHGIIMRSSARSQIDMLRGRVAILEEKVRKLEGPRW